MKISRLIHAALSRQFRCALAAALVAACSLPAAAAPDPVTDADVVKSMRRGIDFLLSKRKGDNWEEAQLNAAGKDTYPAKGEIGGQTAIALYALLHAGDSLQDDADYHAKLNWRGPDLAPSVKWLSNFTPVETYVAGLEASALTLLPKRNDEKPGEGPRAALEACKYYLLAAMGPDGGYTYLASADFEKAWAAYLPGALKGDRSDAAHKPLNYQIDSLYLQSFGGPELVIQKLRVDIRERAKLAKDAKEKARIDAELKELEAYIKVMPAAPNLVKKLATEKATLAEYSGPNPNSSIRALGKDEIAKRIKDMKAGIATMEEQLKNKFEPIGDLSNAQYGTLGAWALADYGAEFPDAYWKVTDRFWRLLQLPDGRWPYLTPERVRHEGYDTMGLAGLATLYLCQEFVDTELRLVPKPDKNIELGHAWLVNAYKPAPDNYYMYSVERVGLASGLKFFGTTDWYKDGAAYLLKNQAADGSWNTGWGSTVSTSYALLFLARGRNPVAFNKLQYNGPWNARPRDNAFVTRWLSKRFEKPINWQIVNLQVSPDEWTDAPVLLITGSQDPKFTKEDISKLRAYINAGGMIFSTADGDNANFTNIMKKVASEIVDNKYEMRQLPRTHDLFSKQMGVDLPNPPILMGMSNGIREIWIHSGHDIGADWQMRRFAAGKTSFELGAALYHYASGMGSLRSKLQPLTVASSSQAVLHNVQLARIDYSGNADPEPGAWPRFAKLLEANAKTKLTFSTVKFADLDPKKFPVAHLTGTARTTFNDDDAKSLKAYLDGGGVLFAEAGGGNTDFADSCRDLFKKIYPDHPLASLSPDHPIYTGALPDGAKFDSIEFRKYGNAKLNRRITAPSLEAVVIDGRTRILFSPWDISSGFLGTNTWGIVGYTPQASESIARNILLFSLNPTAPAN